ncbi:unnamed protein product [Albugo candida]|uniref:Nucleolar protein 56 n=1 Tax=Albugo candida TaxID=65357 RepID=A0A024GD12_9STRA|nr:unnamed protein product [Albugo candida]|eukprot:CCI44577.1 unnamed protein product [Albugo candida]
MAVNQLVLFESASGYALFQVVEHEEVGVLLNEVQESVTDLASFGRIMKLKAFQPFKSGENALENINSISEGLICEDLKNFLEMNLPSKGKSKKAKFSLGIQDKNLAQSVSDELNVPCNSNETTQEIVRGIRYHFCKMVKGLDHGNLSKAQLGLGHSYSRAKVKFNVNRADNMIIQSIALLDQMDKDINTFAMRIREWYSWHFPELVKIVSDNYNYARCASFIKNRNTLSSVEEGDETMKGLIKIVLDEEKAKQIVQASRTSMGMDMSEIDMINVDSFATRLVKLAEYRRQLHDYLISKMSTVAPNLATLIGETVGARLISHAGSLTNLAKCPASTVQILGAEKALFRALKTRGNTPKYGLLFHSTFIGRAAAKNKGRISRYLANKCAIASRIDSFIDEPTTKFGEQMREQVEERLAFYESGAAPRKNADVMAKVAADLKTERVNESTEVSKSKKRSHENNDDASEEKQPKKKKKKNKKQKGKEKEKVAAEVPATTNANKKKKKSHKN